MTAHEHAGRTGEESDNVVSSPRRGRGRVSRVGLSLAVVGLFGAVVCVSTFGAYSDTTQNGGDQFVSGSVDIDDNDNGSAMLTIANAQPGSSDTACVTVTANGSLDSLVRIYGTTTGTGLDPYIQLTVTRGTFSGGPPAFDACTGFAADGVNYVGQGNGVIYNGTLQAFPDSWAAGLVDPIPGSPETWSASESHVYQFVATIPSNVDPSAPQGLDAQQVIIWEARNT